MTIRFALLPLIATTIVIASSPASWAAEMPSKYQGVWGINNCNLPQKESDVGEFPFLIVTRRGYEGHEVSCSLNSVSNGNEAGSDTLSFSCERSSSGQGRLPESLHFAESDVILGVVRARSVHKIGYGHNCDWAAA